MEPRTPLRCVPWEKHLEFAEREVKFAMDEAQIYARLNGIFLDIFDDESIELKPDMTAGDVDGWDSLTHIRLMLTVEKTFNVKFSTAEIGNLKSVGDLVALIKKRTHKDS